MSETTITVRPNGPYIVKGPITVTYGDGRTEQVERDVIALCRCGGSANKPFCDGTHLTNGFDAAAWTVPDAHGRR